MAHQETDNSRKIFTLKPMVFARLLAETTVLMVMIFAPVILWMPGELNKLPQAMQVSVFVLAGLACLVLPFYGFITYKVTIDDRGISGFAVLRKESLEWMEIEKLAMKTTLNWKRYVVYAADRDLSFPVWLANLPQLLAAIKSRLPDSTTGGAREKVYRRDVMGQIVSLVQVALWVLFIVVFWNFYAASMKTLSAVDSAIVLTAGVVLTAVVSWRCFTIVRLPRAVHTDAQGFAVTTLFGQERITWSECRSVRPSFFLLPEGLSVKTDKGTFLVTDNLEGADELLEEIKSSASLKE